MKKATFRQMVTIFLILVLAGSCKKDAHPDCDCNGSDSTVADVSVFATGLNNPRGLEFGPDGNLYVAEGGIGGKDSTIGLCDQVPFPIGPYLGSPTGGRISKISSSGVRTTVVDNLPTSKSNELAGGDVEGVSDVTFIDNTLFALLSGAGCAHGVPSIPNGVVRINANKTWTMIADLSTWIKSHPVKAPGEDFDPEGTPYSMVYANGSFYIMEPNHGDFIKVSRSGEISRVVDISASQGHIVPTAVAYSHGNFYAGNLNVFPITPGGSNIYKITPEGTVSIWAKGLNSVLGITFDDKNRLYVLENTVGAPFPTPGLGRVVRINEDGMTETITSGLNLPTGITFGPDKNLYVSNNGFGPTSIGGGQVLKIKVTDCRKSVKY
jgi:hypothetical protein